MRKPIFRLTVLLSTALLLLASCSKKENATADIGYYPTLDSITWDEEADAIHYDKVNAALKELGIISTPFNIKAEAETTHIPDAVWLCDEKAKQTFNSMLNNVHLSDIRTKANLPTLSPFTVHITLHTSYVPSTEYNIISQYDYRFY